MKLKLETFGYNFTVCGSLFVMIAAMKCSIRLMERPRNGLLPTVDGGQ